MSAATLTTKGQLTLPKAVRERLGLKASDKLSCHVAENDEIVLRRKDLDLADLVGILKAPGRAATVDEMDAAARECAVARVKRGLRHS